MSMCVLLISLCVLSQNMIITFIFDYEIMLYKVMTILFINTQA